MTNAKHNNVYAYEFLGSLYLNLTNKCSNNCTFCLRNNGEGVAGHRLWIDREPSAAEVIDLIKDKDLGGYKEVVFCGYGEPTYMIDQIAEIAAYVKSRGARTRLDTNGQGNLINGYNIVPKLVGVIDGVSVSLNSYEPDSYNEICLSEFGDEGFYAVTDFAVKCKEAGLRVRFTMVEGTVSDEAAAKSQELADSLGIPLYIRAYIDDNESYNYESK